MNIFGTKKKIVRKPRVKNTMTLKFYHDKKYTYEAMGMDRDLANKIFKEFLVSAFKKRRVGSKSEVIEDTYKEAFKILGKKELSAQDLFAIGYICGQAENAASDVIRDFKEHQEAEREGRQPHEGESPSHERVKDLIKKKMQEIGKELGGIDSELVEGDPRDFIGRLRGKDKKIASIGSDPEIDELSKDDKDLFLEHLKNKNEKKRSSN